MDDVFLADQFFSMILGLLLAAGLIYTFFRYVVLDAIKIIHHYLQCYLLPISELEKNSIRKYLSGFLYFNQLSANGKDKFITRVFRFMNDKDFYGKNGLEITDEVKVLISAAAVQLTFGLKNFLILHFREIHVYPEQFYSKMLEADLKGGTTPKGKLMFSWKDFNEGYDDPDDKYNLGLHEMAHALKISVTNGTSFDIEFASYLDNWLEIGSVEFQKMNKGNPSFLRKYGGTNMHEFFAVCVEHFFEVPEEMQHHLPDIYNHLCVLLKQDPSNVKSDYELTEDFKLRINRDKSKIPIPKKITRSFQYDAWHWTLTIVFLGSVIAYPVFYLFSLYTVINLPDVLEWLSGLSVIGLFQYFFLRRQGVSIRVFLLYNFTGFPVIALILILTLNRLIPVTSSELQNLRIAGYYYEEIDRRDSSSGQKVMVYFENGDYHRYPMIRRFSVPLHVYLDKCNKVKMEFNTGIFGIKNLVGYEFICGDEKATGDPGITSPPSHPK
jgi:hypothetical protein